eukprot:gene14807-31452_t
MAEEEGKLDPVAENLEAMQVEKERAAEGPPEKSKSHQKSAVLLLRIWYRNTD